jgi:glutamine synthetase
MNPYLAIAASIAAGLTGVEKNLKLTTKPISGDNSGSEDIRAPRARSSRRPASTKSRSSRVTGSATLSSTLRPRPANGNGASGRTP